MQFFNIKAVAFDMDGVITDSMRFHCQAWQHVLQNHQLIIPDHEIYLREGQKGMDSVRAFFDMHEREFSHDIASRMLSQKEDVFNDIVKLQFIQGSIAYINRLVSQGFRLALVTGTARHEALRMLPSDLVNQFEVMITGTDVHNGKPHPEPYLKALRRLDVGHDECVVIENAPFGITAAKRAGMPCIALETSLSKEYLSEADAVFQSFEHLQSNVELMLT